MTATNFPEFNAAVTELTTKVSTLLGDVAEMQSVANVQVAVDKAAEASASATEAAASEAAAASSAASATSSKDSASASATKAGQWAEANEGEAVEAGKYSAKHHAIKAAASASSASASATTATTKAGEASTSAADAANSAATATTKAGEAAASANTASTKAGEASTSATNAANSAATATTKAGEAASSAANASSANTSAQEAKTAAETARDRAEIAAATVTGNLIEMGGVSLESGVYPAKPANNGAFWKVTAGGTVGGVEYGIGDTLVYSKSLDQFYKIDNTESVTSVAGKTGVVTLTKADVGLGNVDNTSDANKPISTATQTALNAKAPLDSPALTGNPTAPTPAASDNDTSIATTAHVKAAMGLFGLGAERVYRGDLNDLITPGLYSVPACSTNWPFGGSGGTLIALMHGGVYASQLALSVTDGRLLKRAKVVASWSEWREVFHTGNILGTVSQSGGVPTGAIIERGSNANGVYWRFAGGLQVCITVDKLRPEAGGQMTFAWPAGFAALPTTSTTVIPSFAWETPTGQYGSTETGMVYFAGAGGANRIYMQAVGYWHN